MTDQQLAVNALRKAGRIIADYLDPKNPAGPITSLHELIDVLDTKALAAAADRMDKRIWAQGGEIASRALKVAAVRDKCDYVD